jgi:hypothetical protein
MMPVMKNVTSMLVTGGGTITCPQCTAISKQKHLLRFRNNSLT